MGEKLSNLVTNRLIAFVESPIPVLPIAAEMTSPQRKVKTDEEEFANMSSAAVKAVLNMRRTTDLALRRSERSARAASVNIISQVNAAQALGQIQRNVTQTNENDHRGASCFGFFKALNPRLFNACFSYSPLEDEEREMDVRPNNS